MQALVKKEQSQIGDPSRGHVGRRLAIVGLKSGIRPSLEQGINHCLITIHRGGMQSRPAAVLSRIDAGSFVEKQFDDIEMPARRSTVDRGYGHGVVSNRIDIRSPPNQKLRTREVSEKARQMERREAVGRTGCHFSRVFVNQHRHQLAIAKSSGFEYIQRRLGCQQNAQQLVAAVVHGLHHNGDTLLVTGRG